TSPRALEMLSTLGWDAQRLNLVLSSRRTPPIGAARLKVRQRLRVFDEADLALSEAESNELLRGLAPDLDEGHVADHAGRVGGWPAGLVLAGTAVRQHGAGVLGTLSAEAEIAEFMRDEVLRRLGGPLREFLCELAVIGRFDVAMAAQITQHAD